MKISPVMPPAPPTTEGQAPLNTRSIRMAVNRTPEGQFAPREEPPTDPNVAILDDGNQAQGEIEANEPLSPQMAALAKQRRALQVKERELAERERKLTEAPASQGIDAARIKADPLGVLLEAGVTYDDLTQAVIANPGAPEVQKLQQKLKEMEEKLEGKLQDRDQQAEKVHFSMKTKEAERLISQGDAYQMVRDTGSLPLVIQYMQREWKENGEVVDLEEALGLFEEELLKRGTKLASLEKVRGKLTPEQSQQPLQPKPRPPTLTNRDNAQVPMSRKQRALAAFHGQLNK